MSLLLLFKSLGPAEASASFEYYQSQLPELSTRTRDRARWAALEFRSQFTVYAQFIEYREQVLPTLPRRRWEKGKAGFARGDDGVQLPYSRWFNSGWEVQPPQPPHPRREKFGALVKGDDGTYDIFNLVQAPIRF